MYLLWYFAGLGVSNHLLLQDLSTNQETPRKTAQINKTTPKKTCQNKQNKTNQNQNPQRNAFWLVLCNKKPPKNMAPLGVLEQTKTKTNQTKIKTPKGMLFGWFYVTKNLPKTWHLWGSWNKPKQKTNQNKKKTKACFLVCFM